MRQFKVEPTILADEVFWNRVQGRYVRAMVRTRADDYIGGSAQIIDFSADGGTTWIRVANFTPSDTHQARIAHDGATDYLILCGTTGAGNDGFFRSTDSGASFARVTGITGLDFSLDTTGWFEYGLGKWWMTINESFGDGSKIVSSVTDGDTWVDERDGVADDLYSMAISGSGVMFLNSEVSAPAGMFDADGVSIPAPTADFTGLGSTWSPYDSSGGGGEFLFADANSPTPNRFYAIMYNATSDVGRVYYSDDNGTTWTAAGDAQSQGWGSTSAQECSMFWDGTNYHAILRGATNYWIWSVDGTWWAPHPRTNDPDFVFINIDRYAVADKFPVA